MGREFVAAVLKARPELDEIWIIARRSDRLNEIKKEFGDKIRPIAMDITDSAAVEAYRSALEAGGANVKLLINNAGFGKLGNFDELAVKDNAGMVRLNCEALTVISSVTLSFMENGAEIINTCSIASFAPNARMAVYCSTKAYVMSLSRCMRSELRSREINVLAVCPGPMDTEFLALADIAPGASRTFDTLPRVKPSEVAEKSLKASAKGKSVYTNSLFYKFYRLLAKLLPHSLVMKMSAA